jgi:hypothetical protein
MAMYDEEMKPKQSLGKILVMRASLIVIAVVVIGVVLLYKVYGNDHRLAIFFF